MGGHHPRVPGERRVPLGGARARLVGEHVQTCADAARVERREQRRLVDHVTARGVHQDRARASSRPGTRRRRGSWSPAPPGRAGSPRRRRRAAPAASRSRRRQLGQPVAGGRLRSGRSRQPIRIPKPAARSATARPIEPRPTMPRVLPSSPLALLYVAFAQRPLPRVGHVVGDPAVQGQDQPQGELRDRDRVAAGHVADQHARCGPRRRCRWCWCPHRPGSPGRACPPPRTPRGRPSCCGPPARRRPRSDPAGPRWSARAPPNTDARATRVRRWCGRRPSRRTTDAWAATPRDVVVHKAGRPAGPTDGGTRLTKVSSGGTCVPFAAIRVRAIRHNVKRGARACSAQLCPEAFAVGGGHERGAARAAHPVQCGDHAPGDHQAAAVVGDPGSRAPPST